MTNELKLLHNLKAKKKNSLEKAIKIYTPYASTVIYNTVGGAVSKEDIEEVIADTFILLWQNIDNIDETKGNIKSYIGAVARNAAKNKLRSIKHTEQLNESVISDAESLCDILQKKENKKLLINMIMNLGEPDSEIFIRYYYYNEKIRNISKIMNINISTVKSKLHRGKGKLKYTILQNGRFNNE